MGGWNVCRQRECPSGTIVCDIMTLMEVFELFFEEVLYLQAARNELNMINLSGLAYRLHL